MSEILYSKIKNSLKILENENKDKYDYKKYNVNDKDINDISIFINTFINNKYIEYLGCGGTCIYVFKYEDKVYKICLKNIVNKNDCIEHNTILGSIANFKNHIKKLIDINIKIVKPTDYLYENNSFLLYSQPYCEAIENKITNYVLLNILVNIKNMIIGKYFIPDIYYNNFGFIENEIFIYDYHNISEYNSDDQYYISQLATLFSLNKYETLYKNNGSIIDIDILQNDNFGKNYLDDTHVQLLKNLFIKNFDKSIELFDIIIETLKDASIQKITNYQYLEINRENKLSLNLHTKFKWDKFMKLYNLHVNYNNDIIETVVDYGCSIGGIGLKIAQDYPKIKVTLNNINDSELKICRKLKNELFLNNIIINDENVRFIQNKYDVTMYYAILHHILKNETMENIIELINIQTNKYSIIELPFGNDALLCNVMKDGIVNYNDTFYYLENIEYFIKKINKYFDVLEYEKIDYGENSKDLNRFLFILKKKIF
jgi:hypothetical protein